MLSDLGSFLFALWDHWQALVTGGLIAVVIVLVERRRDKPLSWRSFLIVMGIALLWACFGAWRDEHVERGKIAAGHLTLQENLDELRADIKSARNDLRVAEGRIRDKDDLIGKMQLLIDENIAKWSGRTSPPTGKRNPKDEAALQLRIDKAIRDEVSKQLASADESVAAHIRVLHSLPRLTLRGLFETGDFTNIVKARSDVLLTLEDGAAITVEEQLYLDLDAKSKYLGFYIPMGRLSAQDTYDICAHLADNYKSIFEMIPNPPLTFTGRVFIYHEFPLSIEALGDLTRLYRSKGLDVKFRGIEDYLVPQVFMRRE
jgi:hypothetical protein